jgi:hypothetical protein
MWESASPNPVAFLVLDGVGETDVTQRAFSTEGFGKFHHIVAGATVREVFREENLRNILTRCSPVSVNRGTKIPVCGLSVLSHKVILLEESNV